MAASCHAWSIVKGYKDELEPADRRYRPRGRVEEVALLTGRAERIETARNAFARFSARFSLPPGGLEATLEHLSSMSHPLLRTERADPVCSRLFAKPPIFRTANAPRTAPDATETLVAQALLDLENNVPDLKAELRPLQISAAREVDVKGGKKAIVVFVPIPQLKAFHKIQGRLTRELEKKFSDRHVVFIGQRRMMRKQARGSRAKQPRPRSRTLKEVHERTLEDLVFPTRFPADQISCSRFAGGMRAEILVVWRHAPSAGTLTARASDEITGKRTRQAVDGSKTIKVFLDQKDATNLEYKLDSFSSVYQKLTGKNVHFEFSE
ncbi:40S ribosomal protein [Rhodotorula mucilaginosa]|uniref:40S ribosomal protein n=1 Tax=Rhodotorula mucilaginosa TaxID=5537 RepID=A0A9P6W3Y4_RHOMI|nr:40S ribosomal protein [Rhodotorula mucilaginosa]